jgi:hypothetical protein
MNIDKLDSVKWLGALSRKRLEADPIIQDIYKVARSDSDKKRSKVFSEALKKLPQILESVRQAPELEGVDMTELRKIQELYITALDIYIEACKLGIRQIGENVPAQYAEIRSKISLADSYWESATALTLRIF